MMACSAFPDDASAHPNYRVLSEVFGEDTASRALRGRFPHNDGSDSNATLDLAIGILRTFLNEKRITPDDIRRVSMRLRAVLRQRRREKAAHSAPNGPSPNYRVLSEIFGNIPVSSALYGREQEGAPAADASGDDDSDGNAPSYNDDENLDLAIGVLRTLLNEKRVTPDDVRRVGSRWRAACFGNGTQLEEPRGPARITKDQLGEVSSVEVRVVTDDEDSSTAGDRNPARTITRKEPPRRESALRKLNPTKKMKSWRESSMRKLNYTKMKLSVSIDPPGRHKHFSSCLSPFFPDKRIHFARTIEQYVKFELEQDDLFFEKDLGDKKFMC